MSYDKDTLDARLSPSDRRMCLEACGFDLRDQSASRDGWVNSVLGPTALGEGKKPNFSVSLNTGAVKDHGSSGYSGDLYKVVMDVHGLEFHEALAWVADQCGISGDALPQREVAPPSPTPNRSGATQPSSQQAVSSDSEPVATLEEVRTWHTNLMGDSKAARAARFYLIERRGLTEEVLRNRKIGLVHKPRHTQGVSVKCWICIPIPRSPQSDNEQATIVATKAFAFDPDQEDWLRDPSGRKIPRNTGSALYDVTGTPDRPVLLCEGEIDALCALAHGFNAVTGTNGATFKQAWAEYVAGLTSAADHGVVVCFDGDKAGRTGAKKAAHFLHEVGVGVRIAALPEGQDVNDVLLAGSSEALEAIVDASRMFEPDSSEAIQVKNQEQPGAIGETAAPPIPDEVFECLPPLLSETATRFSRTHERDVYLTSALVSLSACMPNVGGHYGALPSILHPNLYLAIVARAASGKSAMRFANYLVADVNAYITKQSEREIANWRKEKQAAKQADAEFDRPEPPERSLLLPANASAAAFRVALADRPKGVLVRETEIDTLTNSLGQDWGNYDDILRKAYHHEWDAALRKEEGNTAIQCPKISLLLSGTPEQFSRLMGSTENGLYSRFGVYYFEAPQSWISQRPSPRAIRNVKEFRGRYAAEVLDLWRRLHNRTDLLKFELTDGQWIEHTSTFQSLMQQAILRGCDEQTSVIKRAGVVAFRIAMICTVLRLYACGADKLSNARIVEASSEDLRVGLRLATTLAQHSLAYASTHLRSGSTEAVTDPWTRRVGIMLNGVEREFGSGEAYAAAEEAGITISERQLRRDLNRAAEQGLIRPLTDNGRWAKNID